MSQPVLNVIFFIDLTLPLLYYQFTTGRGFYEIKPDYKFSRQIERKERRLVNRTPKTFHLSTSWFNRFFRYVFYPEFQQPAFFYFHQLVRFPSAPCWDGFRGPLWLYRKHYRTWRHLSLHFMAEQRLGLPGHHDSSYLLADNERILQGNKREEPRIME